MHFPPVEAIAQKLIQCCSVTPHDAGTLEYLESLLDPAGFSCHHLVFSEDKTPDVHNLYARFGTEAPHFCFAGHVDVVPAGDVSQWICPPFAGQIKEERLYGRGACDMKGGIAAFIEAALTYLSQCKGQLSGSISFFITSDEEGPAINGSAKLLEWVLSRGEKIDHCLLGEPSSTEKLADTIKTGRRGSLSGLLSVHGKQGHVAYPELAENPIPLITQLIMALQQAVFDGGNRNFQASNLEFTSVDVNNPVGNVIPATATARFNVRFNDKWTCATLEEALRNLLDGAVSRLHKPVNYRLECSHNSEAFLTLPGAFTALVSKAIQSVTGYEPMLSTHGGISDARFIKSACPVLECGLLSTSIHQVNEYTELSDLRALSAIYHRILSLYFSPEHHIHKA